MTLAEEIMNKDGYLIFTSERKLPIGEIVAELNQYDRSGHPREIKQPFTVTRIATQEEFTAQMVAHGAHPDRILYCEYFYEARTD